MRGANFVIGLEWQRLDASDGEEAFESRARLAVRTRCFVGVACGEHCRLTVGDRIGAFRHEPGV